MLDLYFIVEKIIKQIGRYILDQSKQNSKIWKYTVYHQINKVFERIITLEKLHQNHIHFKFLKKY